MVALTRIMMSQTVNRQRDLSAAIARLETAIATGRRLERPSDAPQAWAELSDIARRRADLAAIREPVSAGLTRGQQADRWLAGMADSLGRARELVVLAGGTPGVGRTALVAELTAMRDDLAMRLTETSANGLPVLDQAGKLHIALGGGRTTASVPTADNVHQINGGLSLTDVLDRAVAAATSGADADIASALADLELATSHIATEQAQQGIRLQRLEETAAMIAASDVDLSERQSAVGDTDIAAAITTIQTLSVQRDAARAILSRTSSQTLFDYLR